MVYNVLDYMYYAENFVFDSDKSKFILLYEKFFRNIRNENVFFLIVIIRGGVCICGL